MRRRERLALLLIEMLAALRPAGASLYEDDEGGKYESLKDNVLFSIFFLGFRYRRQGRTEKEESERRKEESK